VDAVGYNYGERGLRADEISKRFFLGSGFEISGSGELPVFAEPPLDQGDGAGQPPTTDLGQAEADRRDMLFAGDANRDFYFDQLDIVQVLTSGKYMTGQPATWDEGDWNGDGRFDQADIVAALQSARYRPRSEMTFGTPGLGRT
jgi:hypothetical protein